MEDSGYWDLVYLLYPEAVEAAGLGLVHELVSSWPFLERTLAVGCTPHPFSAVGPFHCIISTMVFGAPCNASSQNDWL